MMDRIREVESYRNAIRIFNDRIHAGKLLAEKAREKGIVKAVFDRGGCKFHGRVAALAEGARAAGLKV